jgi:outer membrane protein TolC
MFKKPKLMLSAVVAIAVVFSSICVTAQETAKAEPLSLAQCIEIARKGQTDVITAGNNIIIAKKNLTQKNSAYLPQVSIQNNTFAIGDEGVLSRSTTGTAISIDQNIYDGGLREASVEGARYGVQQRLHALDRTLQTVTFDVTQSYYTVLRSKQLAEVSEANVKYNEELRSQIESRAKLGDAAQVDVLPVEAQLASAQVDLLSARRNVRTSLIKLQSAMGLAPKAEFDIQAVQDAPLSDLEPTNTLLDTAIKSRPDLLQAQASVGAAKTSVKTARISIYPRPVITGGYSKSLSGGFSQTGGQIVGSIVFDAFDGGANRAVLDEAKAAQANSQEQVNELTRQIHAQVEDAAIGVNDAKDRIRAAQSSYDASHKNLDVQIEKYGQGLAITLDMLNAEAQLISAQSSLVQARYDYYIAVAQLEYALGK